MQIQTFSVSEFVIGLLLFNNKTHLEVSALLLSLDSRFFRNILQVSFIYTNHSSDFIGSVG